MSKDKKKKILVKNELHERSKHRGRYDLKSLVAVSPELASFVFVNKYESETIDFSNPDAVIALNKALLKSYYGIDYWNIPKGFLCPPIPGRVDYIHHISDLLGDTNNGLVPKGDKIKVLDIGVGASCIYPILGIAEYNWSFIASDVEEATLDSCKSIIDSNNSLKGKIELKLQPNKKNFFNGVISKEDKIDLSICNPPFHESIEEAQAGTTRKWKNLKKDIKSTSVLNFGGQQNELWYKGGERRFIKDMIFESKKFGKNCLWFSTLVSRQEHLNSIYNNLDDVRAERVKTINMGQGQKISRVVAWSFLTKQEQQNWCSRWE